MTYALRSERQIVEQEIVAVFDVEALIARQDKIQLRRESGRETESGNSDRSTQRFIRSRIYYDQNLSKRPHCNSDSLQHYTTADPDHLAHNGVREWF